MTLSPRATVQWAHWNLTEYVRRERRTRRRMLPLMTLEEIIRELERLTVELAPPNETETPAADFDGVSSPHLLPDYSCTHTGILAWESETCA